MLRFIFENNLIRSEMKQLVIILTLFTLFTSCQDQKKQEQQTMDPEDKVTVQMFVSGMTCAGCEKTILKNVSELDGIIEAHVSHEKGTATIVFDKSKLSVNELSGAISRQPYHVESFIIDGQDREF
ncbi:MAG: heavy-metal-associated domain-containing protein [Bacteroidetes bacterium]|nr:heavy-metal-associated domain-containing protein [Bacteroidota bacterium]